ncbi:hypothetical protein MAR_037434 [Mya arenaria]|uniref:Transposase n=1 Tax=Mya arenaria TaxID=6604 RepID=A0ABY7FNH8_MYAAR|nr:hypothetical protein MAR_037434 [Mya arenaria]
MEPSSSLVKVRRNSECQCIAADYARPLGKTAKDEVGSNECIQAESRKEVIANFFTKLEKRLIENGLLDASERIYIVDESAFTMENTSKEIVFGSDPKTQTVTAEKSKTVTMIESANAKGHSSKHIAICKGADRRPTLILCDGRKFHLPLTLVNIMGEIALGDFVCFATTHQPDNTTP